MPTMQQVVDAARVPLNDKDKDRVSDTDMLSYANTAIGLAYKLRPDLRYGFYGTDFVPLLIGGTFPLPDHFMATIADYVGFRCELIDDESATSGRAGGFLEVFNSGITTL